MMLVELLISLVIFLIASAGAILTLVETRRLGRVDRETQEAAEAIRAVIARVRSTPVPEILRNFNADPADDVGGAGTAPGNAFDVLGLRQRADDVDGRVGEVILPTQAGNVMENIVDADLGMPRDLNLDGAVDNLDHSNDYRILPIRVRVQWAGVRGPRTLEAVHFVSDGKD